MKPTPTPILFGHVVCDTETGGCGHGQPVEFHHGVEVLFGKETMTAKRDSYIVVDEPEKCRHCGLRFARVEIGLGSSAYYGKGQS